MALVNKPDESIFASSAKQGEVDNFPDLLRGWGITFEQTQGIPPMEWFNFLFKRLDEKHAYLMQRGLPEWSATQDYTKGSCVQFDGVSYRALKNSKNNHPNESNSQYWVRWGFTLAEIARATLTQYGLTQLYTGYDSQREDLALTPKTAFLLKQLIDSNTRTLGNVIPNSKKSDAVNSNSSDTVATSKAVKTAYDKAVNAENLANTKWTAQPATETTAGILPISHKSDGTAKDKFASEYAVGEAAKKGLPVGAIVAFPSAVTNPNGFLRANGSTFNASAFPDLYKVLGNSNTLPDLTRSDVGMTAYFTTDAIPSGWIAFDDIAARVSAQTYPELYRYLVAKYGSISDVPKAADRFIRNAGAGLQVGKTQEDAIRNIQGQITAGEKGDRNTQFIDKLSASGPFRRIEGGKNYTSDYGTQGGGEVWGVDFDASRVVPTADENRPKSIVLKLCIKAVNTFDDVVFWVKSHGDVVNIGALDAGRLAQDIQQLNAKTQQIERHSNQNEQLSLELKNQLSQIKNKEITTRKIWQGNVTNGSSVLTLSERVTNKNLVFYLQSSSGHTLSGNDVNTVSCYIDNTIQDVGRSRFAYAAYWDGGWRNLKIEIVNEKQIKLVDSSGYYLKAITVSD